MYRKIDDSFCAASAVKAVTVPQNFLELQLWPSHFISTYHLRLQFAEAFSQNQQVTHYIYLCFSQSFLLEVDDLDLVQASHSEENTSWAHLWANVETLTCLCDTCQHLNLTYTCCGNHLFWAHVEHVNCSWKSIFCLAVRAVVAQGDDEIAENLALVCRVPLWETRYHRPLAFSDASEWQRGRGAEWKRAHSQGPPAFSMWAVGTRVTASELRKHWVCFFFLPFSDEYVGFWCRERFWTF